MSDITFHLDRRELSKVFSQRGVAQFETLQQQVSDNAEALTAGVASTQAQAQASYVTLSPNDELANEYVLSVEAPLALSTTPGGVTLSVEAPSIVGGHSVTLLAPGPVTLSLPLAGTVLVRERIPGAFADDTAAAAGGVAVGECYWKGADLPSAKLATRMV